MESEPHNLAYHITQKNKPKLSPHAADEKENARRLSLVPEVEHFVANHELFAGKNVSIEFSHTGVSSLVCMIETAEAKYVLKIPLHPHLAKGESYCLEQWEAAGVSVPHIFEEGHFGEYPYMLMNFIDAPTLDKRYTSIEKLLEHNMYGEMGKMQRRMHTVPGSGFGKIIKNGDGTYEGPFTSFKEWVESEIVQDQIAHVTKSGQLTEEHGSIERAIKILLDYAEAHPGSVLCHFDLSPDNVLATEPITIFDPNPMCNLGIVDAARTILIASASSGSTKPGEQFKAGYFLPGEFNPEALQAAIILAAYQKFPHWMKVNKTKNIQSAQTYLVETRLF